VCVCVCVARTSSASVIDGLIVIAVMTAFLGLISGKKKKKKNSSNMHELAKGRASSFSCIVMLKDLCCHLPRATFGLRV